MARYGLIGGNRGYSQFRRINEEIADYEYDEPDMNMYGSLGAALGDESYDGFNISNPYKVEVIQHLDELSEDAERAGAVDVVKRLPDGRLKGYNTEMAGLRYLAEGYVEGRKCLILGTGGASTSAARALLDMGALSVVLVSRDPDAAAEKIIMQEASAPTGRVNALDGARAGVRLGDVYRVTGYDKLYLYYDSQVIVNCTPVGRSPDIGRSPLTEQRLSARLFTKLELAIDMNYDPYRTKFLQDARRLTGCYTRSGIEMLIFRAIASRNIWLGKPDDMDEDRRFITPIKRRFLKDQLNVIAVGMPGSGKTTIFRRYAYEMGLKFIDTDEETEKLMGRTIAEVLSEDGEGEEYFKEKEHEALLKVCRSHGAVIATGGSTALNPVNRDLLRANGIVVYVKRPLEMLDKRGRQISINRGLAEFFHIRDGVYRRVSDMQLLNARIFGEHRARTGEGNTYNYELRGFVYFIARKIDKYLNWLADNKWT